MKRRHALWMLGGLASCRKKENEPIWRGVMFGIPVSIRFRGIDDDEVQKLGQEGLEKARKVERATSLWDENSSISQLNRDGEIFQATLLKEIILLAKQLYEETGGVFDPSIYSYYEWLKKEYAKGRTPSPEEAARKRVLVDFSKVEVSQLTTAFQIEGMSISLNAIAQGYATDLVARYLEGKVNSALVNFGEYRVVGEKAWDVEVVGKTISVSNALAVSSGSGERLSATSVANHLIDPRTGESPPPKKVVAVEAPEAWLADGLATVVAIGGEVPDSFKGVKVYQF
jgi:thiamine biosynthesis lipoprotein